MPRFSAAQDRPVPGPVKIVPPRERLTALRWGAPPEQRLRSGGYMAAKKKRTGKISSITVSTLSGEPRSPDHSPGWVGATGSAARSPCPSPSMLSRRTSRVPSTGRFQTAVYTIRMPPRSG
jgi:hypothetical protein